MHAVLVEETEELSFFCFLKIGEINKPLSQSNQKFICTVIPVVRHESSLHITKLTFAVASIFSGSTKVRNRPINCTAPPSSGSVSQIMCSMMRLIKRMSCRANKQQVKHLLLAITSMTHSWLKMDSRRRFAETLA